VNDPRESALIVPVPEAEDLVGVWRERYDDSARTGVPAHLTLLYPFLTPEDVTRFDLQRLSALFAAAPATRYELVAVRRFSRGVLYLAPEPEAFLRELTGLIWAQYPHRPPYGGVFDDVIPHLTVAQVADPEVLDAVEASLAPRLPISAHATEAWLMLQGEDGRWRAGHRFPLGNSAPR